MKHYRINQIKLKIGESKGKLPSLIEKKLGLKPGSLSSCTFEIRRESIDARNKSDIRLVYTVDIIDADNSKAKILDKLEAKGKITACEEQGDEILVKGDEKLEGRPVIAGLGPCGLFAALELAANGYKPLVIERGMPMSNRISDVENFRKNRILDPESNMLFGEGGAGTFSDGKLTSGIKDGNIRKVLKTFKDAGAGEDIMYLHKPHIGTDVLREVIVNLREKVISLGGEVVFSCKLTSLEITSGKLSSITVLKDGKEQKIKTNALILAIGHSARDTFELIKESGLDLKQKPFSIGLRMEHPQSLIDKAQYGDAKGLPPADYKLSYHASNGRGVYSFCMCPGGEVVTCSTKEGELCVNGMSNRKRDSGTANSGILCDVRPEDFDSDDVLAGVYFQQKYERLAYENGLKQAKALGENPYDFSPPKSSMKDFLEGTQKAMPLCNSLPSFAEEAIREAVPEFGKKIKGYDNDDAVVTAVETRSSSPIRILRDEEYQSNIDGIYPAGEGAGYAGGITSAACDGIRVARAIMARFSDESL